MKKLLGILVLGLLWCNAAFTESILPPCQGEDHMQWTNCFGTYLKKDLKRNGLTRDYTGEFGSSPGKREGKGRGKVYKNGNLYIIFFAEYKNDKGIRGTYTWPDGKKFVGEVKDNKFHGQGTYTWPDGSKFVGEYKDGKEIRGTYTWADGEKYVGEYKDDKFHGQGTYTWPDGSKFVGEYKDGKENGQGTYTWQSGQKFVGEYKDGKKNGQGTHTWQSGQKYVGEYKDGEYHGQGTLTWADGQKYVGGWKDGEYHGQGTYTWPDGYKIVAVYKDGEEVKRISSTVKKESSSSSSSSSTFSSSTLSGYDHCKSVWRKLIDIRDGYSKNSPHYYRLDALVQTAFDMWTTYQGTNLKDTGNCDILLSSGNK